MSAGLLRPTPDTRLPQGQHIRPAGEEARCDEVLLPAGTALTPPALGLAAAAGNDHLWVHRAAAVQTFVLGDELLDAGPARDGCIRDALGPQLPGWLEALGATGSPPQRLPDRLDVLIDALACASRSSAAGDAADVLMTTGGSSAGPLDHVRAAVRQLGGGIVIDQVAVRPGHPMALAWLPGDVWLIALPGNPLAACAALLTLAQPLLGALAGRPRPDTVPVTLAADVPAPPHSHRLLPARQTGGTATPLAHTGSGMLRGLAAADILLAVPPGGAPAGATAEALALPWSAPRSNTAATQDDDEGICT